MWHLKTRAVGPVVPRDINNIEALAVKYMVWILLLITPSDTYNLIKS